MKKIVLSMVFLGFLSFLAADGAELYKKCVTCHGEKGEKVAMAKSKVINTMSQAELETAMKGYKDGSYGGAMKGLMKTQLATYTDAQIAEVAAYIAQMK
jgi:cytochrome c553